MIIAARFQDAGDFSEGLAAVKIEGKWGYVDKDGQMVIPPAFERASDFREGLSWVDQHGKCGFIDRSGAFRVKPSFFHCKDFHEGLAVVGDREDGLHRSFRPVGGSPNSAGGR